MSDHEHEPRHIEITQYASDPRCPDRWDCPGGFRVNVLPGGRVIQGDRIPDDVMAELIKAGQKPSETAVWIPDDLEV